MERDIEKAIIYRINLEPGCFAWKVPDQRKMVNGQFRADPLIPSGQPDITASIRGQIWFIEVKTDKGALSPKQTLFHGKLKATGANVMVARKLEDIYSILKERVS